MFIFFSICSQYYLNLYLLGENIGGVSAYFICTEKMAIITSLNLESQINLNLTLNIKVIFIKCPNYIAKFRKVVCYLIVQIICYK